MLYDSWFSGSGSWIRASGSLNSQEPIRLKRIFRYIVPVRLPPERGILWPPGISVGVISLTLSDARKMHFHKYVKMDTIPFAPIKYPSNKQVIANQWF